MDNLFNRGATFSASNSLLTATGAETVHDTTVRLDFSIAGKFASKSGTNVDQVTPTTDAVTAAAITMIASQMKIAVWCYNSSGAVKVVASAAVDWDGTVATPMPTFPDVPATLCPFAYQVLKTSSTAGTITFGTSNWNATGFTNAIVNVSVLPNAPQIS